MQETPFVLLQFTQTLTLAFRADALGRAFLALILVLWAVTGLYALRYKDHQDHNLRFFAFYLLTLLMLAGLSMAANYVTMYLFFEMMTLCSFPLVLHNGSAEAVSAAKKYLFYSIFGATLGLLGLFFLHAYSSFPDFKAGGVLDPLKIAGKEEILLPVVFLAVVGFGVKAGLVPLHSWLPAAHPVAPSPASAFLSGIITKAGAFCIIRVIYFQFGPELLQGTWVQRTWLAIALLSIMTGSLMAYREPRLKTRLAYSTVSQVSYVLLGIFFLNQIALAGALLHALYHSVLKSGLFLSAGNILYRTGRERVEELKGLGRSMPWTLGSFAVFSLGLTGIPPFAGFLSKWVLAQGALGSSMIPYNWLAPAVLILSALLTAGYLFPIVTGAFFPGQSDPAQDPAQGSTPAAMVLVVGALALASLGLGLLGAPLSLWVRALAASVMP